VTSVNPTTVNAGDTFAINGTGFYPNLVQAVLIGGTAVDQANVTTVSDTQINVVAPDFVTCEFGCTVVVQTTQGASNDNVTISIIPNP
ncbi:MAG: IPT/TIG domain-containing protein, partial [Chthoniobacterales bacterium]|nr:IPT/TIG domain-containing protein [Chthoniobacterales bacterium]